MRYYRIEIEGVEPFTTHVGGKPLAGALLVELDMPVSTFAAPKGAAFVKIWGLGLKLVSQATDLNFRAVKVFGGMQRGLPLANPAQSGLLIQGYIQQAFGNWNGTEQSIDIYILAGPPPVDKARPSPRNLSFDWKKGKPMSDAIKQTLQTGYPGYEVSTNISPDLVLPGDEPGLFESLLSFSQWVKNTSLSIIKKANYPGVSISLKEKKFEVYDATQGKQKVTDIKFLDLIGQPTWIDPATINFKTAMRADLNLGDFVKMPPYFVSNSARAASSLVNQKAAFQGKFLITDLRHVGNSRQADAASWVTVINAAATEVSSS